MKSTSLELQIQPCQLLLWEYLWDVRWLRNKQGRSVDSGGRWQVGQSTVQRGGSNWGKTEKEKKYEIG